MSSGISMVRVFSFWVSLNLSASTIGIRRWMRAVIFSWGASSFFWTVTS